MMSEVLRDRALTPLDDEYPERLRDLEEAPPLIFVAGTLEALNRRTVAIVGTRTSTRYGERVAYELAMELADAGVCIVSGLARGIDAAAHRGALAADGFTCAVLGTGLDIVYPAGHASLQRAIGERGLLVTESRRGERLHRGSFPIRNRIIAALGDATIVVEAGRKSGALGTAGLADNLGRSVAVVPGPIDSPTSVGSNGLLRVGAIAITCTDDALVLAGVSQARVTAEPRVITPAERIVLRALGEKLLTTEQIVFAAGLPVAHCLAAISTLELEGMIETSLTGELRRRAGFTRRAAAAAAE